MAISISKGNGLRHKFRIWIQTGFPLAQGCSHPGLWLRRQDKSFVEIQIGLSQSTVSLVSMNVWVFVEFIIWIVKAILNAIGLRCQALEKGDDKSHIHPNTTFVCTFLHWTLCSWHPFSICTFDIPFSETHHADHCVIWGCAETQFPHKANTMACGTHFASKGTPCSSLRSAWRDSYAHSPFLRRWSPTINLRAKLHEMQTIELRPICNKD